MTGIYKLCGEYDLYEVNRKGRFYTKVMERVLCSPGTSIVEWYSLYDIETTLTVK